MRNVDHQMPYVCAYCESIYVHLTSLMRHLRSSHIQMLIADEEMQDPVADVAGGEVVAAAPENINIDDGGAAALFHGEPEADLGEEDEPEEDEDIDLAKSAGRLVLNLRQTGGITSSTIQRFEQECTEMINDVTKVLKKKVKAFLDDAGINTEASTELLNNLKINDAFGHIKTIKQQLSYFHSEFGMVKPESKFIDYRIDYRLNPESAQYEPTQVSMSCEYISVIETLKLLHSNPKFRALVANEKRSEDGVFRSYLDGSRAKENAIIRKYPNILRIQLYWDDVEVVNALGSKTTIHKIAAFYFCIQNLPAVESSQLSSVFLLALAYSEDLKTKNGFEKVLAPFLQDLQKLESDEGVPMQVDNEPFVLRATLTVLCADTLAAHEILGFLSPSARHFCRICLISRQEFHLNLNAVGARRTRQMFDQHVEMVQQRRSASRECGVKQGCPLHDARYFDATQDSILDIFHDILEGVCHWVLSLTLRSFIDDSNYFTLDDFNGRISAFNYGVHDVKNKPSANFSPDSLKGKKLKQTGSQMWCLTRVFGFLVADVPEDDLHLKLVNLLQRIMLIAFAEEVRPEDIDKMDELIEQHHTLFQQLHVNDDENVFEENPDSDESAYESDPDEPDAVQEVREVPTVRKKVKPGNKLHQMKHLGEQMRQNGPLVRLWCARYEGRHHIFCKYGAVCCNFINIVKSMAQMYQMSTLSGLLKTSFRSEEMELGASQDISVQRSRHRDLLIGLGLRPENIVADVKAVVIAGEDYRPAYFVLLEASIPTFGLIQRIYVFANQVYLIAVPWQTVGFEERYCAYRVERSIVSQPTAVNHRNLARHGAFAPWNPWMQRSTFIAPRTIIF